MLPPDDCASTKYISSNTCRTVRVYTCACVAARMSACVCFCMGDCVYTYHECVHVKHCLMYGDLHFVQMIRVGLCKWLYKCMRSGLKSLHYTILQI